MGPVTATVTADAPRERAYELVADLANRPGFTDHFIDSFRLERLQSTGLGAGARFRTRPPLATVWIETEVEALEPPYRIRERGRSGRIGRVPTHTVFEFVSLPGGGCEIAVTFWTEPRHPVDLVKERLGWSRWYRRRWARALRRLRELVEESWIDSRRP